MANHLTRTLFSVACSLVWSSCGDDAKEPAPTVLDAAVGPATGSTGSAPPAAADAGGAGPVVVGMDASTPPAPPTDSVFALHYTVTTEGDTRISYVYLSKTLDFPERIDVKQSREFFGYANSTAVNGFLLMSEEGSVMKKYAISSDLKWSEAAQISFANYADLDDVGFWRQAIAGPHSGFLLHNGSSRLIWDPTDFKIGKDVTETQLAPKRDGLELSFSANRDPANATPWKGPVLRPFNYQGEDAAGKWITSPDSLVVRYAPETFAEQSVTNVPCPDLQVPSQDEQGNTYFSGQGVDAHKALFPQGVRPCVAKFDASGTYDPSFTSDFAALTGGRLLGAFRYVRNGIAIGTVLHHEEVQADYTKPLDEATDKELAKHWYLWTFDLNARTAKQTSLKTPVPRAFMSAEFGERYFVFPVAWEPVSEVTNYELSLDGTLTPRFKTPGFAYTLAQVR